MRFATARIGLTDSFDSAFRACLFFNGANYSATFCDGARSLRRNALRDAAFFRLNEE